MDGDHFSEEQGVDTGCSTVEGDARAAQLGDAALGLPSGSSDQALQESWMAVLLSVRPGREPREAPSADCTGTCLSVMYQDRREPTPTDGA